ncbi:hypothetical protein H5410_051126 [Solanum commersonii]|uniref:Uncharacterized protein n=1 Tax=Solanum commersonii TaxID=4109 RepID=A0A9J5WXH1_SOLCO|nr:hypothetical protein H5410_051126 [Solanum commersonii]
MHTTRLKFTYARINFVLKDSSCGIPLPKILMLAILATYAIKLNRLIGKIVGLFMQGSKQANHTRHRHLSQTKLHTFASVQRLLQENYLDKWLTTMRCKEYTYCLCNFIWPHRSRTFIFVRLRALFKSSVLIETETQFFCKRTATSTH